MYISNITKYIDINIIKRRKRKIENIFTKYNGYEYEIEDIFNNSVHNITIWSFTWSLGNFYFKDINSLSNLGPMYNRSSLNDITEWGNNV